MFSNVGQIQPYHMVGELGYFYGFQDEGLPKVTGAPELCTWLDAMDGETAASGPCLAPGPSADDGVESPARRRGAGPEEGPGHRRRSSPATLKT